MVGVISRHSLHHFAVVPVVFFLASCGGKDPAGLAKPGGMTARPPVAAADAEYKVILDVQGGPFAAPEKLSIAVTPPAGKVEALADGFRLSVADPAVTSTMAAHRWGLWVFADGLIKEEATLRCRTGTQLVLDGVAYAPAAVAKAQPGPTTHKLDATVVITRIETERGLLEGEIQGTFLAPDGKSTIKASGTLQLPWPQPATPATAPQ